MMLTKDMTMLDDRDSVKKFYDDDNFQEWVEKAYRETIPALFTPKGIKQDSFIKTLAKNFHIFEFDNDGVLKYLLAFRSEDHDITMCISALYVHPKYRNQGIGTELVERFIYNLRDRKIVLVTSASPSNHKALDFFYGLEFISPLEMDSPDDLDAQYVDLLWSKHKFSVRREFRHLMVEFNTSL